MPSAQQASGMVENLDKGIQWEGKKLGQGIQMEAKKAQDVLNNLHKLSTYKFEEFVQDFGKSYKPGSKEYKQREVTFYQNMNRVLAHNSGVPSASWFGTVNKFMDYSPSDKKALLGYNGQKQQSASSFLEKEWDSDIELPEMHEWGPKLGGARDFHRDQGSCGSCWAVAAAQVLEDHIQLKYNESVRLSEQSLVSCTPNPQQCGGKGGCGGATAELAFQYAKEHGVPALANWQYTSGSGKDGVCDATKAKMTHIKIGGYVQLPENKQAPLLQALYQHGPVVVSADASNWFMYGGGVFSSCSKDAVINHAIVAEGFGKELSQLSGKMHKYFLIKNSWGRDWGEHGFIKLERLDDDSAHCGIDNKPEEGTGCLGGPKTVKVCGMCGMLYDSAYPTDGKFITKAQGGTYVKGQAPFSANPAANLLNKGNKLKWESYDLPFGK